MKKKAEVTISSDPEEISTEVLATEVIAISEGIKKLRTGRLSDSALFLLIHHAMPVKDRVPVKTIKAVLEAAEALKDTYIKKQRV